MPPPHPQHANLGVRGSSLLSILCDILYIDQYLRVAVPDCQIRFGNFLARVVGGVLFDPIMHLSILCPTTPCTGIGGGRQGIIGRIDFLTSP